ncbi:MAG: hypothetical protein E7292_00015 [Lachnospiraceae bacterium]|nr:hypothetical protein [Lachnospiraceae bacterium]
MREELRKGEVLAMYDVRGIQKYIFRTNKIKEIIGASSVVENIITELRFIKLRGRDIKRLEIKDSDAYDDAYVESVYVLGSEIDKVENLKQKVDVVNYISYDENDMLQIVNYRLKEAE